MTVSSKLIALLALTACLGCGPPRHLPPLPRQSERPPAVRTEPLITVDGEVLGVDRVSPGEKLASGPLLRLEQGGRSPLAVQLAPDWYLDREGLRFAPRERVEVRGSRAAGAGQSIVAWQIRKGDRIFRLRDESGKPLWEKPE